MTPTPSSSPSILLIDDHAILLEGLGQLLQQDIPEISVATASSVHAALQLELSPTVIVIDIRLPGINGVDGLILLRRRWPAALTVMLSAQDDDHTRKTALERGAHVFLSKAEASDNIVATLQALLAGETPSAPRHAHSADGQYLTARQCQVLELLCQGMSNKLIARQLDLSDNTVRRHVQDVLGFFGVSNRTEAVFEARRRGMVR